MSKTEFPLPKGCAIENIEIDVKNNLLTIVYEEEKPVLKVGEWWYHSTGVLNLIVEVNESMQTVKCIPTYGIAKSGGFSFHGISTMTHKADIEEVISLLIKEAKKKGCCGSFAIKEISSDEYVLECDCKTVFDFKTGKWAEIVEVKKPLYVNQYGTEFFEGDTCYYIDKPKSKIKKVKNLDDDTTFTDTLLKWSEIMTKKECYQYLADRCKE